MRCLLPSTLILLSLTPTPTKPAHAQNNSDGSTTYTMLIVSDLDRESRAGEWLWRSISRVGHLTLNRNRTHVNISWESQAEHNLTSTMNVKGRAMELSDLSVFHNRILTPDDRTGMISEIRHGKMIPWVFLNSGPGNTTHPFKSEWMTIKDDLLYVGSHGNEWVDLKTGKVIHRDNMWVKTITTSGQVTHVNWTDIYDRIRNSVNISSPGYLTHEAVQWSEIRKHWYFLPRKESLTIYNETLDEWKATNLMITGNRNLTKFEHRRIGKRCRDRGYSAFDFIPGTQDRIIVALKTSETAGEPTETFLTVFTVHGRILLPDQRLDGDYKFEGIYFI